MQVFVVMTSSGIWSVCSTIEVAEEDKFYAIEDGEESVKIHECGVYTGRASE